MKAFILTIVSILLMEVLLGYLIWIRHTDSSSSIMHAVNKIIKSSKQEVGDDNSDKEYLFHPESLYLPDEYLGYSDKEGSFRCDIKMKSTNVMHSFTSTINRGGNRITSRNPEYYKDQSEIWIFGDSFTYGWANNDDTTFPFILQNFILDRKVVNFSDCGYGNIHGYLQLKRELLNKEKTPDIMIFIYGDYYNIRNVAAPSWLKRFEFNEGTWQTQNKPSPNEFTHPRASIVSNELSIEYVPLFWSLNKENERINYKDPPQSEQFNVTKRLLKEMYDLGKTRCEHIVLAHIMGETDEVIEFCEETGFTICDIRPSSNRNQYDSFYPFDGHPGPLAQNHYALKVYETIKTMID